MSWVYVHLSWWVSGSSCCLWIGRGEIRGYLLKADSVRVLGRGCLHKFSIFSWDRFGKWCTWLCCCNCLHLNVHFSLSSSFSSSLSSLFSRPFISLSSLFSLPLSSLSFSCLSPCTSRFLTSCFASSPAGNERAIVRVAASLSPALVHSSKPRNDRYNDYTSWYSNGNTGNFRSWELGTYIKKI